MAIRSYWWRDDYEDEEDEFEIPLDELCDWCGERHPLTCACDSSLFDADELGLDPEEDNRGNC